MLANCLKHPVGYHELFPPLHPCSRFVDWLCHVIFLTFSGSTHYSDRFVKDSERIARKIWMMGKRSLPTKGAWGNAKASDT